MDRLIPVTTTAGCFTIHVALKRMKLTKPYMLLGNNRY